MRFISEDIQNLKVRIINVIGELVYTEELQEFIGEYTKSIDLASSPRGIYFLQIEINHDVINTKLILE